MKKFLLGAVGCLRCAWLRRGCRSRGPRPTPRRRRWSPRSMTGAASTSAPTAAGVRAASAGTQHRWRHVLRREGCHDATGGVAGGQVGYRWQSGAWVFGIEAQGDWADLSGNNISLAVPAAPPSQVAHQRFRPLHRPGRLRRQQRAALRQGRCRGDASDRFRVSGDRRWVDRQRAIPAGAARSASASNTASPRTGRPPSNTIICSCRPNHTLLHQRATGGASARCSTTSHPSGRRSRHRPHQLSLGRPGHREVLSFADLSKRNTKRPALRRPFCSVGRVQLFQQRCCISYNVDLPVEF